MLMNESNQIINAFTVDVEDYFHVQAFAGTIRRDQWDDYESRVVKNTHRILRLLDNSQTQGTFFMLGWVADKHPSLVRDIQKSGHEIGCHSYWHRLIYEMSPDEFRSDLRQAGEAIEQITAQPVTAFRAPCFSITQQSLWALDILIEEGYRYDSSLFPVRHDTYGIPNAKRFPFCHEGSQGALLEFPLSVRRLWKYNVPSSGGGYFRLYPFRLTLHCLRHINQHEKNPFVFYVHPWEIDPDQPRMPASLRSRFRHYQNLRSTESKLKRLLKTFRFGTLSESLAANGLELLHKDKTNDTTQSAKAHLPPLSNVTT
jgi:polysaccharide deacetylase family protein (PEP-CTERM system associated)